MNLTPISLEEDLKALGQTYGNDLAKDTAKTRVRRLYNEATLLETQYAALQEVAVEMARDNVSLRLENEALKSAGQAVITPEHFWNLETAVLNGVREIFSEQSEPAYQPVVNPPKEADTRRERVTAELVREQIDLIYDEQAQEYEAICYFYDDATETECSWQTTGNESVCDDAAWAHAESHVPEAT